ncbi:DUF1236 domain-containing protein [Vibrio parahaemolyticus]|uniref:DUF1236 domain-containing protein n=1 Tax=Microvirga mediterraneensis TaxID=2754695 RepID=A0A838BIQ7_9HYPH|nr:DUF1236 domain-containing protein [Microvirga mediterraneensis]MBA1154542.1 DUF1236 domain-containing protein [Microvirga mediterraneensis]MDG2571154.1 DUF1236 domain-containing protein [Vibrio parahaemolyticus]
MKAAYHLVLAVFSVGTVAGPTTAPNATGPVSAPVLQANLIPDVIRNVAAEVSSRLNVSQQEAAAPRVEQPTSVGESLSHSVELHPIPRHETYRYAMVDGHRLIVDAASRKIVYVIQ